MSTEDTTPLLGAESRRLQRALTLIAGLGHFEFTADGVDDVRLTVHVDGDPYTPAARYLTPDDADLLRDVLNSRDVGDVR